MKNEYKENLVLFSVLEIISFVLFFSTNGMFLLFGKMYNLEFNSPTVLSLNVIYFFSLQVIVLCIMSYKNEGRKTK